MRRALVGVLALSLARHRSAVTEFLEIPLLRARDGGVR